MATANPISNVDQTDCLLICPYQLFGDMLDTYLAATRFRIDRRVPSIGEAQRTCERTGKAESFVILALCCTDPGERKLVAWLNERCPDSVVVVLATRFDPNYLQSCVNAGVDGFLHADMSAEGFVRSLELLLAGEKVFPSRLAAEMRTGELVVGTIKPDEENDGKLNSFEIGIVRLVVGGAQNKTIARDLDLSEAIVKMHLRQIFAKLKVQNRTQAATWGLANGLAAEA